MTSVFEPIPVTTDDTVWCHLHVSDDKTCFEDRFCSNKITESGRTYSRHAMHVVAALALCRTVLVSTGWTTSHPVSTNGH